MKINQLLINCEKVLFENKKQLVIRRDQSEVNVKNAKQKKKKEQEEEGAQAIRFLFHDFIISDGQRMLINKWEEPCRR